MKVYGVYYRNNENETDMQVFTDKEKAQKVFEQVKYDIELEYKGKWGVNIIENTSTEYSIYVECSDCFYEGQTYFVKLKEFEI